MYVAGIAPGCAADRRLIDGDHLVEMFEALDPSVRAGSAVAGVEIASPGQRSTRISFTSELLPELRTHR